mgnify:CR=1 FL=1
MQLVANSAQRSAWQTAQDVLAESGVRGFYVGVGGYIALWGTFSPLMFCLYEQGMALAYRRADPAGASSVSRAPQPVVPSFGVSFLFGSIAGFVASAVTSPLDVVKTRLQCQTPSSLTRYNGVFDGLHTIYRDEGPRALFRGTVARSLTTGLSTGIMMGCYGVLRAQCAKRLSPPQASASLTDAAGDSLRLPPSQTVGAPGGYHGDDGGGYSEGAWHARPAPAPSPAVPAAPASPAKDNGFIPPLAPPWASFGRVAATPAVTQGDSASPVVGAAPPAASPSASIDSASVRPSSEKGYGFIPPLPPVGGLGEVFGWGR